MTSGAKSRSLAGNWNCRWGRSSFIPKHSLLLSLNIQLTIKIIGIADFSGDFFNGTVDSQSLLITSHWQSHIFVKLKWLLGNLYVMIHGRKHFKFSLLSMP